MTQLYILAAEYRAAEARLQELDLDEQTIRDTLDGLMGEFEDKVKNIAMMLRNRQVTSEAIKKDEMRQKKRREAIDREIEYMERYLIDCMNGVSKDTIETAEISLLVKRSTAVKISEFHLLPKEYIRWPPAPDPEPDKNLIAAALKAGKDVSGAYIEHRRNLIIK